LNDPRPEPAVAAAWALRALAVPETFPKVLDHFQRNTRSYESPTGETGNSVNSPN